MFGAPAPAPSPKTEATLASVTSSPSQKPPSPPRRQKPRQVIYKSTALVRAAPGLVAAATPAAIAQSKAIKEASAEAERVRDQFKLAKCGPEIDVGEGDDEATNAKKYERRLLMNRHSAAASRVRREAYTKALEAQVVRQEQLIANVRRQLEEEILRNKKIMEEEEDVPQEGASDVESDIDENAEEEEEDMIDDIAALDEFPEPLHFAASYTAPSFAIMESQTEETSDTSLQAQQAQLSLSCVANNAHIPIPNGAGLKQETQPKLEEVLANDFQPPIPVEFAPFAPSEKLLESFLYEDPVQQPSEFGNLDFS